MVGEVPQDEDEFHLNPFAAPVDPTAAKRDSAYPKKAPAAPVRDTDLSTGPGGLILLLFPVIAYGIYYLRKPVQRTQQRPTRHPVPTSRIAERLAAVAEAHKSFKSNLSSFSPFNSSSFSADSGATTVNATAITSSSTSPQTSSRAPQTPSSSSKRKDASTTVIATDAGDTSSKKVISSSHATQTDTSYLASSAGVALRQNMRRKSRQLRPQPSFVSAQSTFEDAGMQGASTSPTLPPSRLIDDLEEERELNAQLPESSLASSFVSQRHASAVSSLVQLRESGTDSEAYQHHVVDAKKSEPVTSSAATVTKRNGISALFRRMMPKSSSAQDSGHDSDGVVSHSVGTMADGVPEVGGRI
ncbi:hypothetical protein BC829DRAFT_259130 [Chytridium lagenaria]|nr:hypothetical protein BC829DRAFT_259130 [Chytridium lagenaria]